MGYRRVLTGITLDIACYYTLQQLLVLSVLLTRESWMFNYYYCTRDKFRQNDDNRNTLYVARFRCR